MEAVRAEKMDGMLTLNRKKRVTKLKVKKSVREGVNGQQRDILLTKQVKCSKTLQMCHLRFLVTVHQSGVEGAVSTKGRGS